MAWKLDLVSYSFNIEITIKKYVKMKTCFKNPRRVYSRFENLKTQISFFLFLSSLSSSLSPSPSLSFSSSLSLSPICPLPHEFQRPQTRSGDPSVAAPRRDDLGAWRPRRATPKRVAQHQARPSPDPPHFSSYTNPFQHCRLLLSKATLFVNANSKPLSFSSLKSFRKSNLRFVAPDTNCQSFRPNR